MTIDFAMLEDSRWQKLQRMRVAAAVIGGVGLAGAVGSAVTGNAQANATQNAVNSSNAIQQQEYEEARSDEAPYRQAGYTALNTITQDQANGTGFAKPFAMSDFYNDPGYQFTLNEGNKAIQNSAAARGGTLNGGTLKALDQYSTGLAENTYGDAYNRYLETSQQQYNQLAGVAGLGQSAINTTTQAGTNAANQESSATLNGNILAANQRASGYANAFNSLGGAAGAYYGLKSAGYGYGSSSGGGSGIYDGHYGLDSD